MSRLPTNCHDYPQNGKITKKKFKNGLKIEVFRKNGIKMKNFEGNGSKKKIDFVEN